RKQPVRFEGDLYSPRWVRNRASKKEGLCRFCRKETWLCLKDSAYWYHVQFHHGICASNGRSFEKPVEYREESDGTIEGFCGHCRCWIQIHSLTRHSLTTWYHHAHK
ncbi:hypothetical protein ROZALSC1DRAFT_10029, partial [Rozella allomycis CSF55]